MAELRLERRFDADPERVFQYLTKAERLLEWWGPEGISLPDYRLDFDRTGPWFSVMRLSDGRDLKVSGHVTHVDPPKSVGLTWAWHDENDRRGVESHVTIRLVPRRNGGTTLTLTHADLPEGEPADSHERGWTSTLGKLERLLAT